MDYGAFEEVTAGTAGHGADMGQPGVQTQMMIKSGGNEFHGSLYGDYQNSDLQATNITDEQVSRGIRDKEVNRMKVYYDFNARRRRLRQEETRCGGMARFASSTPKSTSRASRCGRIRRKLRHFSGKTTFSLPGTTRSSAP